MLSLTGLGVNNSISHISLCFKYKTQIQVLKLVYVNLDHEVVIRSHTPSDDIDISCNCRFIQVCGFHWCSFTCSLNNMTRKLL